MSVLLIRHASAGDRDAWTGDDRLRPLDERGRQQAERLVELLEPFDLERLVSSPYDRCVQTLEPFASARALAIEPCPELGEDLQENAGAALVRGLASEKLGVCCHGGLSWTLVGENQKKGEAIVLELQDDRLIVRDRLRS